MTKNMKTLKDFQALDGWPESLDRFADFAARVKDCRELSSAGKSLCDAEKHFRDMMEKYGVELG